MASISGNCPWRLREMTDGMDMQSQMDDEMWMRVALEEARRAGEMGEVPIGAILVQDRRVIASGHNMRETWRDPTAHAEFIAIQAASRSLGSWRLTGCTLYVTLEPCPMCAGAIMLARVHRLVFGATDAKGGAVISKCGVLEPGLWNHQPNITSGILHDECANILKGFFKAIRNR